MAHFEQRQFCEQVKEIYPEYFKEVRVLDIGSLDINGSNRDLFDTGAKYVGIDVADGKNVDIVCPAHRFEIKNEQFDTIISTECFEHDMFYEESLQNICHKLLRSGGLFLFTCATTGRPEHGTRRTSPQDAPLLEGEWSDYYKNLTEKDIREAVDIDEVFSQYFFFQRKDFPQDLYFWGIKR
jgi:SAM-dependent methyltransferase